MQSLKQKFVSAVGAEANDVCIDSFLLTLQQQRIHMLHTHLRSVIEMGEGAHFQGSVHAQNAVLSWLQTPRTLGELASLSVMINEGLILFTETGEEAEHIAIDASLFSTEMLTTEKQDKNFEMTQFEKELDTIACTDASCD